MNTTFFFYLVNIFKLSKNKRHMISYRNKNLLICFTLLTILCTCIGDCLAQADANDTYLNIQKVVVDQKFSFEIGEEIKFKLKEEKGIRWNTRIITGFDIEKNQLIFNDQKLAISSIDKILIIDRREIGRCLTIIIGASVGIVNATNIFFRMRIRNNIDFERLSKMHQIKRIATRTALAATIAKLITGRKIFKVGKKHQLKIVTPNLMLK